MPAKAGMTCCRGLERIGTMKAVMGLLMGLLMALVAGALMLPGGARATGALAPPAARAAITETVQVGPASAPFSFVPGTTAVDVGDGVLWNWKSPSTLHSVPSGTCFDL